MPAKDGEFSNLQPKRCVLSEKKNTHKTTVSSHAAVSIS
jgi:hypothetical protein